MVDRFPVVFVHDKSSIDAIAHKKPGQPHYNAALDHPKLIEIYSAEGGFESDGRRRMT
jgi:hypothetical protein